MNKTDICIWNREFSLPVFVEEYDDLESTAGQKDALKFFLKDKGVSDVAIDSVAEYLCKQHPELKDAHPADNLFRYVMPKSIFIARSEQRVVAILCDYKFDMEHGIAIVFENEKLKEIGPQDIIL